MIRIREVLRTANCNKFLQDQLQLAEICDLLVQSHKHTRLKKIGIFSDSTKQHMHLVALLLYIYTVLCLVNILLTYFNIWRLRLKLSQIHFVTLKTLNSQWK